MIKKEYDIEIMHVLSEAGQEGLSVKKVSHHVLNACNSLFTPLEYDEVRSYVQQYLIRNSRSKTSMLERMEKRGDYRLNLESRETMQLILQFRDDEEVVDKPQDEDNSLSLFDF